MQLISKQWNTVQDKWECTYLADNEADLTADFAPECAIGSQVLVISAGAMYIKNTQGKWQKNGTTEVIG